VNVQPEGMQQDEKERKTNEGRQVDMKQERMSVCLYSKGDKTGFQYPDDKKRIS